MRPHSEAITIAGAKRLTELERVIGRGQKTFLEVGLALAEIRDLRLYRATHKTLEEYCREKWGWGRAYAYRLIDAADVAKVSPMGDKITTERQARELAKVEPERRAEVLEKAASRGQVTAKSIKDAANPSPVPPAAEPDPEPEEPPRVMTADERLESQAEEVFGTLKGSRVMKSASVWLRMNYPKDDERRWAIPLIIEALNAELESLNP